MMPLRRAAAGLVAAVSLAACLPSSSGSGGGSGTAGTSGGGGTGGGTIVMKDPSNYPENTAGAAFPFPQGHAYPNCAFPAYNTDTVSQAYDNWKAAFVVASGSSLRVQRPENGNDTVSEGMGYGMLLAVFMNDKPTFDGLWAFVQSHLDGNGLMNWCQMPNGATSCSGANAATDGDEDIAYALLMANKQWAGGSYGSAATTMIGNIYNHEVESGSFVLKPGDVFGGSGDLNPSYLAPAYYRAFARATNNSGWMQVLDKSYAILAAASGQYGLVPNWGNASGGASSGNHGADASYFGYDACRTPFRIALDYCLNGEARAQTYANLIAGFYASKVGTGSTVAPIKDGYTSSGGDPPTMLGDYNAGMAFTAPAGAAAMAAGQDHLRDVVYTTLWQDTTQAARNFSGVFTYYHASWGLQTLLFMSGNFWDMTQ
jgi:endo-1,4-beta-D-glucanase Y